MRCAAPAVDSLHSWPGTAVDFRHPRFIGADQAELAGTPGPDRAAQAFGEFGFAVFFYDAVILARWLAAVDLVGDLRTDFGADSRSDSGANDRSLVAAQGAADATTDTRAD